MRRFVKDFFKEFFQAIATLPLAVLVTFYFMISDWAGEEMI